MDTGTKIPMLHSPASAFGVTQVKQDQAQKEATKLRPWKVVGPLEGGDPVHAG